MLEVTDLHIRRGEGAAMFEMRVARLDLKPGHVYSLQGPSGSGKSTLLETLALLAPMEGLGRMSIDLGEEEKRIEFHAPLQEADLDAYAHLRAGPVGFVAQSGGLLPFLDANAFARASAAITGEVVDEARFERIVARLDIGSQLRKGRAALSGGQRKRIALLRGLATPRRLLLVDEPSSGLDDHRADSVVRLLVDLAREENTVVLAAMHDTYRAETFGLIPLHLRRDGDNVAVLSKTLEQAA